MTKKLTTISPEQQAIAVAAEAGDISALKSIADMASGLQMAAKRRRLGIEDENKAAELVLRAERSIGQLLSVARSEGRYGREAYQRLMAEQGTKGGIMPDGMITLKEFGIATQTAARMQLLASLTDEEFEGLFTAKREAVERIAKVDFYRLAARADLQPSERVKAVQELLSEEDSESVSLFAQFKDAAAKLDVSQLPFDELAELATIIQRLAADYKTERSRRIEADKE